MSNDVSAELTLKLKGILEGGRFSSAGHLNAEGGWLPDIYVKDLLHDAERNGVMRELIHDNLSMWSDVVRWMGVLWCGNSDVQTLRQVARVAETLVYAIDLPVADRIEMTSLVDEMFRSDSCDECSNILLPIFCPGPDPALQQRLAAGFALHVTEADMLRSALNLICSRGPAYSDWVNPVLEKIRSVLDAETVEDLAFDSLRDDNGHRSPAETAAAIQRITGGALGPRMRHCVALLQSGVRWDDARPQARDLPTL